VNSSPKRWFTAAERWALGTAFVGCAGFSVTGLLSRATGTLGSPWFDLLPRYLTLVICFLGATRAAALGDHIRLDLATRLVPLAARRTLHALGAAIAAVVCVFLAFGAATFVWTEVDARIAIMGLMPSWLPALSIPVGFAICAARFASSAVLQNAARPRWWVVAVMAFMIAVALAPQLGSALGGAAQKASVLRWCVRFSDVAYELLLPLGAVVIGFGLLVGTPLFAVVGAVAALLYWSDDTPIAVVAVEIYRLVEAPTLVTLPLFTFIGAALAKSSAPARLVAVARAAMGWVPGGILVATVVVCAFFTTFSGASGVTIIALGLLLDRMLGEEGYDQDLRVGLITSSGSIGLLFAPALPLIVYGVVAKVDVDDMFVAGIMPGLLLLAVVAMVALMCGTRATNGPIGGRFASGVAGGTSVAGFAAPIRELGARSAGKMPAVRRPFVLATLLSATKEAAWELFIPVLVLGLLLSGVGTVTESAAAGALYTALVVFGRDLRVKRDLLPLLEESGRLIGVVLIILGVALAFTGYLVDAEIPQQLVAMARANLSSAWSFLLIVNVLLLVVGCILDIFSAIIIFVPLLVPVAKAFDVDPVHLGVIFLANLEIGYLTPPVGMNLFLAAFRFERELPAIWKTVIPFLLAMLLVLAVITWVPWLSLALVNR